MNRHDLSDKHMRKQKVARQEEINLETEKLKEDESVFDVTEEEHWNKKMPPIKRKPHK